MPRGDCLSLPTSAATHSGDSTVVTPTGHYTSWQSVNPPNEFPNVPNGLGHTRVTNPAWLDIQWILDLLNGDHYLISEYTYYAIQEALASQEWINGLQNYDELRTILINSWRRLPISYVEAVLEAYKNDATLDLAVHYGDLSNNANITVESINHFPTFANIEDESDLCFLTYWMTNSLRYARNMQTQNEREQQDIRNKRETSECNQAFHQDAFNDLTRVNFGEVEAKYRTGQKLCKDLDVLYKENCVTKQTFYKGVTKSGCC